MTIKTALDARTVAGKKYMGELDNALQEIKTAAESGKFSVTVPNLSSFVEKELGDRGFAVNSDSTWQKVISW